MIWSAYCGYCSAIASAPANDFCNWASTLSLIDAAFGASAIAAPTADAYPAVSSAPRIDCMTAPPRSRWRSAVPDAIPARVTGTEPVSEWDAGVPANPTPGADEGVAEPDRPVRGALVPQQQHGDEAEQAGRVADEQRRP